MGQAVLYAWDPDAEAWVKVQVNADGELVVVTS